MSVSCGSANSSTGNPDLLADHELFAMATTGRLVPDQLGLAVTCFRSGPFGGDQQIGARIAEGEIDLLVFFWDPLEPTPTTRRQSSAAGRGGLQHPHRLQPRHRRLPDFLTP